MPGFFEPAKQALELRNKMKKLQREVEAMTKEYANGGVGVVVTGDMTVKSVEITDKSLLDPAKEEKLVRTFTDNVNKALHLAKDAAQERMKALSKDLGLGGMLGG